MRGHITDIYRNFPGTELGRGLIILSFLMVFQSISRQMSRELFKLHHTRLLTYLLTLRRRALLEKLTGSQLARKFPLFYETRRSITTFTSARYLSLFWAKSIQSLPPPPSWRYVLILSSYMSRASSWSLFLRFPHQKHVYASPLIHKCHMPRPSHYSRFDHPNNIWWAVQIMTLFIM